VIDAGLASLTELQTVYGTEDLHNLLEIAVVNAHNRRLAAERARQDDDGDE
jgi:hypothetical protein